MIQGITQACICERRFRLLVLLLWLQKLLCFSEGFAHEFEVTGTVTYTVLHDNVENNEKKWLFRFSFKDDEWNAKVWDPLDEVRYDESGFQGDAVYSLRAFPSKNNSTAATYSAVISVGPIPRDDQSMIGYLWLAYGSSRFFSEKEAGMLEPVWQMGDPLLNDSSFKLKAYWELRDGIPKVPASMTYISDGFARFMEKGQMKLIPVPSPYDKGYTNAVFFSVGNITQGDLSFPRASVFRNYYVTASSKHEGAARLLLGTEIKVEISAVKEKVSIESLLPQFMGHFNIQDRRAKLLNPAVPVIIYSVTNGNWPRIGYVQQMMEKRSRSKVQRDLR